MNSLTSRAGTYIHILQYGRTWKISTGCKRVGETFWFDKGESYGEVRPFLVGAVPPSLALIKF